MGSELNAVGQFAQDVLPYALSAVAVVVGTLPIVGRIRERSLQKRREKARRTGAAQ